MPLPAEAEESGRRTYLRERIYSYSHALATPVSGAIHVVTQRKSTYQKQRVSPETIKEHQPPHPTASALAPVEYLCYHKRHNHPDEFISAVRHQIQKLAFVADAENVCAALEAEDLDNYDCESGGCGESHDFGVEGPAQTGKECGEQDVGHEGHDGDVHIGRVEVITGGQEGVERVLLVGVQSGSEGTSVRDARGRKGSLTPGAGEEEGRDWERDHGLCRQGKRTRRSLRRT